MGDKVELSPERDSITEIYPRSCSFVRPAVSNINQMIVVISTVYPKVDLHFTDTLLFGIETRKIDAAVCINKSDLDEDGSILKAFDIYQKAGYKTIITSAKDGRGKEDLYALLKDRITAFAGNSGVGKSSLLNLIGEDLKLETGDLSAKTEKGRHTTRHTELLPLPCGGYVLDTPGFGKLDLPPMTADEAEKYFREFAPYRESCEFTGCSHTSERGCAVLEAARRGEIAESRMESYIDFYNKLKEYKKWQFK